MKKKSAKQAKSDKILEKSVLIRETYRKMSGGFGAINATAAWLQVSLEDVKSAIGGKIGNE
jgi:hypothetical protein